MHELGSARAIEFVHIKLTQSAYYTPYIYTVGDLTAWYAGWSDVVRLQAMACIRKGGLYFLLAAIVIRESGCGRDDNLA